MVLRMLKIGALTLAALGSGCTADISGDPDGDGKGGGTAGNNAGGSSNNNGDPQGPIIEPNGRIAFGKAGKYHRVIRLTNTQWTNSVQSILALPTAPEHAENFQNAVSGVTDFTNNELGLAVDNRDWSDLQAAAEDLAAQVTADSSLLSKLYAGNDAAGFIATVGRRVHRRPLTAGETAQYQRLYDLGAAMSGNQSAFAKGVKVVLEAMLQSPHFLYRTELGAAGAALSGHELAAKLSLWLRDRAPDDALLDAAAAGQLDSVEGVTAQTRALLDDPAAKSVMRRFHGEFLHFGRFNVLSKVGVADYEEGINEELLESSHLFFDKIFSQGLGIKDIFTSTKGFVGPRMAKLYGGDAPASGFMERDLGASRPGYFTQLPFLALYAINDTPDAIHRGVSISLDVLCAPLGPPSAEIPPLPPAKPGQTNRMRVDEHTKGCGAACHNNMINPLGFAFENFDGMGRYREVEKSGDEMLPINASGSFTFVGGKKDYNNASELMSILASEPQAHLCYSKKLASFGLQRNVVEADLPLLSKLATVSMESGASLKEVIVDLVAADEFRKRAGGAL